MEVQNLQMGQTRRALARAVMVDRGRVTSCPGFCGGDSDGGWLPVDGNVSGFTGLPGGLGRRPSDDPG